MFALIVTVVNESYEVDDAESKGKDVHDVIVYWK